MSMSATEMKFRRTDGQIEQWKRKKEEQGIATVRNRKKDKKRDRNKSSLRNIRNSHHRITTANAELTLLIGSLLGEALQAVVLGLVL